MFGLQHLRLRRLSSRILLVVLVLFLVAFALVIYYQTDALQDTHFAKEIDRSRALTVFCEEIRQFISSFYDLGIFDGEELSRNLEREMSVGIAYRNTKMYRTIPVVAAWTAARAKADELGYAFRIPRSRPRNPLNQPRPGLETAVVEYLEGRGTLDRIRSAGGVIVYPPEPETARQQGEIGVLHTGIETLNPAEGGGERPVDAIRFFRAIRLTEDCLRCHGSPAGSTDPLGFKKEGWKVGQVHGAFEIISSLAEMRAAVAKSWRDHLLMAGALFLVGALLLYLLVRHMVSKPIRQVVDFAERFGKGDFRSEIPLERHCEIGEMTRHLNLSVQNLKEIMVHLTGAIRSLSDASGEILAASDEMDASAKDVSKRTDTVSDAARQVSAGVSQVAAAAEAASDAVLGVAAMTEEMSASFASVSDLSGRTAERVDHMARSGEEMSQNIESIAASVTEMTASLGEVAERTGRASRISREADQRAGEINARMDALSGFSKRIGKVVNTIKDIADQTHLLALNATIEAAGAGEAGKGFAVVAGEVKALAKQSAEATDEIGAQIEEIRTGIKEAVSGAGAISGIIGQVVEINEGIAVAAKEQTASADEISRRVTANAAMARDVLNLAKEAAQLVGDIARATDETAGTAAEVARNVDGMAQKTTEIARASADSAARVREIFENIDRISNAAGRTAAGAEKTNRAAKGISGMAADLLEKVRRFSV